MTDDRVNTSLGLGVYLTQRGIDILTKVISKWSLMFGHVFKAADNEAVYVLGGWEKPEDLTASLLKERLAEALFKASEDSVNRTSDFRLDCVIISSLMSGLSAEELHKRFPAYAVDRLVARQLDPIAAAKVAMLLRDITEAEEECIRVVKEANARRDSLVQRLKREIAELSERQAL